MRHLRNVPRRRNVPRLNMMRGTRDRAGNLNPSVMRNNTLQLTNRKARHTRINLIYLARHWPGGARLCWPLAKGATFASYEVPMALRAVWETR